MYICVLQQALRAILGVNSQLYTQYALCKVSCSIDRYERVADLARFKLEALAPVPKSLNPATTDAD